MAKISIHLSFTLSLECFLKKKKLKSVKKYNLTKYNIKIND